MQCALGGHCPMRGMDVSPLCHSPLWDKQRRGRGCRGGGCCFPSVLAASGSPTPTCPAGWGCPLTMGHPLLGTVVSDPCWGDVGRDMNARSTLQASSLAIPTPWRHVALWASASMGSNASRLAAHRQSQVPSQLCSAPKLQSLLLSHVSQAGEDKFRMGGTSCLF